MIVHQPTVGWALGCSRTGTRHQRSGVPCQDAFGIWCGSSGGVPYLFAAVADGHGAARHDLSRHGSELAVRAAWESALDQLPAYAEDPPSLFRVLAEHYPRAVSKRWQELIQTDSARHPPSSLDVRSRYGTTLIAALVLGGQVWAARVGDGEAYLWAPEAGKWVLPRSESLVASETESLSSPDVLKRFRQEVVAVPAGSLLLIGTDGLCDGIDDVDRFASNLAAAVQQYGLKETAASQPRWLDHFSSEGGGDDITLVAIGGTDSPPLTGACS